MLSAITTNDGFSIQGTTSDSQEKIAAYYKEQAGKSGWAEETTMTQPEMVMLSYTKATRGLAVIINPQDEETAVSVTVTNQ